jgi:manganese transport protein
LLLQRWGIRRLEAVVIALVALVGVCFAVELMLLQPPWGEVARGFIPQASSLNDSRKLFVAAGILGATVMPHNLYLHSSLVKSRHWENSAQARSGGLWYSNLDTVVALALAFLVNAAILVLAGGSFYQRTPMPVADLDEAYRLLTPILGTSIASLLFGVGLLAAGQSSTLTATLAGQVVMEGFLNIQLPPWQRRLITRTVALIPAMVTVIVLGDQGINTLLVLSQVVLSLQLPFAAIPLVWLCSRPLLMGDLVAPGWLQAVGWSCAGLIVLINGGLLISTAQTWLGWG